MPTYPTPEPITVTIDVCGDIRIAASDRADTVVLVRPADPAKADDVRAAEQTTVELAEGRLDVRSNQGWQKYSPFGGNGSVEVTIELPTGSAVTADSALGQVVADGELGRCRLKTSMGNIRLDQTGALRAKTGFGDLVVDRVMGDAELTTGSGALRAGLVRGSATVKSSNGDVGLGTVAGDLWVKAANGDITVEQADASATAKTANGAVRVAQVSSGDIVLETAAGEVEVGVRDGTAAWLDAVTKFGAVRNGLDTTTTTGPAAGPTGPRVTIRARTAVGDIVIGRSTTLTRSHPGSDAL